MTRSALTIEYALLGLLYQQPRHGYEIYQELLAEDGLSLVWRLKQSHLYALLAKLEQQNYVTATLDHKTPARHAKYCNSPPPGARRF